MVAASPGAYDEPKTGGRCSDLMEIGRCTVATMARRVLRFSAEPFGLGAEIEDADPVEILK